MVKHLQLAIFDKPISSDPNVQTLLCNYICKGLDRKQAKAFCAMQKCFCDRHFFGFYKLQIFIQIGG